MKEAESGHIGKKKVCVIVLVTPWMVIGRMCTRTECLEDHLKNEDEKTMLQPA